MFKSKKIISSLLLLAMTLFAVPAFAQDYMGRYWGAVAFDKKTGLGGGSWDYNNQEDAEEAALGSCIEKHKDKSNGCRIITAFYNGCVAVYWSPKEKEGGWGYSDYNAQQAEARAETACIDQGGGRCQQQMSFCTTMVFY